MDDSRVPITAVPRAVLVAAAFFGALALVAWAQGVFERLGADLSWTVALFAAGYAAATCLLDDEIRAWLKARLAVRKAPARSPAAKRAAT